MIKLNLLSSTIEKDGRNPVKQSFLRITVKSVQTYKYSHKLQTSNLVNKGKVT